jgi:uroporphyrinogen-III synthase
MRVLVVRPAPADARTAQRLKDLGHEAVVAPLLIHENLENTCPTGVFDVLLATSAQAFRALAAREIPAHLRAAPLYVVGARTGEAAQRLGFSAPRRIGADAAALAQLIAQDIAPRAAPMRALYLAGVERKPHLEADVRALGLDLAVWEVYAARAASALPASAAQALAAGGIDAALHFSRRSAEVFCALAAAAGLADPARRLRHVAISADAAQGLRALGPPDLRVAAAPDEGAMLSLLDAS